MRAPACLRQPYDPPWSPSGRLWGSGVPSTRSQIWALGRAFEHACRPVSGRASRLKNASLAEASLGLSRLQKERAHGWRGGPRQSRDERRLSATNPLPALPRRPRERARPTSPDELPRAGNVSTASYLLARCSASARTTLP